MHSCGGKFLLFKNPDTKFEYVVCEHCFESYLTSYIQTFCCECNEIYYSSIMENDYDSNKQLVTWEKYHCNAVINDCIKCPKCKGKLYLHLNQNKLICEECCFISAPEDMNYVCLVCKKEFKAKLKIYNPIEFHVIKVSIKNALLFKNISKPDYLPCCKQDTKSIKKFFHKKECKGILYAGKWINNNILVCSKCKMLSEIDKFIWTCPLCFQRFKYKNSSQNLNMKKFELSSVKDKEGKEPIENSTNNTSDFNRSKSPNVRSNYSNNSDKTISEGVTNNITNLIINNNININNVNYNNERGSSSSIGSNLASSPNISNDLQNLLKNKNIDIDFENLKAEAGKFKNIISNMNLDKISENNPVSKNRKLTSDKINSGRGPIASSNNKFPVTDLSPNSRPILSNRLSDEGLNFKMRSPNDMKNININLANLRVVNNNNINNNNNNHQNSNLRNDLSPNDRNLNNNNNSNKNITTNQYNNYYKNNFIYSNNKNNNNINLGSSMALQQHQNSSSSASKNYKPLDPKETEAFNLIANNDLINYDSREDENLKAFDCEDFKVITQIGEGSFGKIYLVEDKHKRQFSMKKIIANDEMDVENFTQEYELVNKVRHKNILRIHSICRRKLDSTTHALYILMEKGVTDWEKEIKARQVQKKFYSEKELFNILGQLTEALSFLQLRNISHRDIKPQNVLLFKEGIFKIADFGEAKKISIIETCKQLSTLRGTELYMSPLLFNGLRTGQNDIKHNSFKSDVFSLGFCLFYAATLNIHCLYELRRETDTFNIGFKIGRALKNRYSDNLVKVLLKMLEINENKRCDFIELQETIKELN